MNYDENPIRIDVEITNKEVRKFSFFVIRKRKSSFLLLPALLYIVYILLKFVKEVIEVLMDFSSATFFPTLILLLIMVIMTILFVKKRKKSKKTVHIVSTYIFKNDSIEVSQQTQGTVGHFTLSYSIFSKIYEEKDAFYLMLNENQGHVIPKKYLSISTQSQLIELLLTKVENFKR